MKRLRTRQRYVNLAEEKVAEKQQHCEQSAPVPAPVPADSEPLSR